MTALQKVNLGTAPTGTDGDTVRTANVKANANIDVLNSQAALASAVPITNAQALTAAHIGKRLSINLAAAGVVNMPAANVSSADSVVLLRNAGATVVSLAIAAGSGDTLSLSKLNPGETALFDTDGVHVWTVLMRGRTNSDNETVNGNCAVGGNETVGGTLGVTGNASMGSALSVAGTLTASGSIVGFPGRLLGVTTMRTAGSGNFVRNPLTSFIRIRTGGAGGGGGGCPTTGAGQVACGSGGAGGGWVEFILTAAQFDAYTVSGAMPYTVGAGGVGSVGGNGTAGGATTIGASGAINTCNGGNGGATSGLTSGAGQVAGPSGGGVILKVGTAINAFNGFPGTNGYIGVGGAGWVQPHGANSPVGTGGRGGIATAGEAAIGNCAGGGGTVLGTSQAAISGSNGSNGYIEWNEYS